MSRSYRKFPCVKDSQRHNNPVRKRQQSKTYASRLVRRKEDVPSHSAYRKFFCSWDISDYRFIMTERDLRRAWEEQAPQYCRGFRNFREFRAWWYKVYKRK